MEIDRYGIENYYNGNYDSADKSFDKAISEMKLGFKKVPKINSMERKILEFCAGRNMKEFLREEFEKHPIRLDQDGNLIGENPFDVERRKLGINETYQGYDPLYGEIKAQQILDENHSEY